MTKSISWIILTLRRYLKHHNVISYIEGHYQIMVVAFIVSDVVVVVVLLIVGMVFFVSLTLSVLTLSMT